MNGILIVANAVPGVHLIDSTGHSATWVRNATAALRGFFASSAAGGECWLSAHEDIDLDELPNEIRLWPSFTSFFHQFGAEWAELEEDDIDDDDDDEETT